MTACLAPTARRERPPAPIVKQASTAQHHSPTSAGTAKQASTAQQHSPMHASTSKQASTQPRRAPMQTPSTFALTAWPANTARRECYDGTPVATACSTSGPYIVSGCTPACFENVVGVCSDPMELIDCTEAGQHHFAIAQFGGNGEQAANWRGRVAICCHARAASCNRLHGAHRNRG